MPEKLNPKPSLIHKISKTEMSKLKLSLESQGLKVQGKVWAESLRLEVLVLAHLTGSTVHTMGP